MQTYPVKDAEYGSFEWLLREVGGYLGFGHNWPTWGADKLGKVTSIIESGYRQFLHPPPLPTGDNERPSRPHQWSFLTPVATLDTKDGVREYDLEEDFNGVIEEFTVGG